MKTTASDKFTVAEYLKSVQNACWGDTLDKGKIGKGTWTDVSPAISSVRRSLQREYLNLMEPLARTKPGMVLSPDLHAMIQSCLHKLNGRIDTVLAAGQLDFASEAHLTSCQSRIERMLKPELDEYGGL